MYLLTGVMQFRISNADSRSYTKYKDNCISDRDCIEFLELFGDFHIMVSEI